MHYSDQRRPDRRPSRSAEWRGGERYGDTHDDYYAELRGTVTGARPGDRVEVWFTGVKPGHGPVASEHFTYRVHDDIGGDVLVLAAEDVTGLSPAQDGTTAKYADEIAASLDAAGYTSDVYDFDAMGRKAPHPLGVLSHYQAVVWETGDDIILRAAGPGAAAPRPRRRWTPNWPSATTSTRAASCWSAASTRCSPRPRTAATSTTRTRRRSAPTPGDVTCLPLLNDFQQYYLGAYNYVSDGGTDPDGDPYPVRRRRRGVRRLRRHAQRARVGGQPGPHGVVPDHVELPAAGRSSRSSPAPRRWTGTRPGGAPFDPRTGDWYLVQRAGRRVVQAARPAPWT